MIIDSIRSFLGKRAPQQPTDSRASGPDPVHVAACALLLDIAYADGEFSDAEKQHLHEVLARQFGLSSEDGDRLMQIAEDARRKAVDHFGFTSVLHRNYDIGQKMVLAEVMWGLVLADGRIADHEQYLTRKISHLLELEPAYLATAKASAEANRRN